MMDEYDDGAVFKDNAMGISGVDAEDYILPVNDISVPQVIETENEKGQTIACQIDNRPRKLAFLMMFCLFKTSQRK